MAAAPAGPASRGTESGIYVGTVAHARRRPHAHVFRARLFLVYIDLDELPGLFRGRWFWSVERFNVATFKRRDYFGPPERAIADCVRERVRRELGSCARGPVRMLTHLAYFGYCFNPVTFYYVFEEDGTTLHAVLAEITNTPWGEKHAYVLGRDARGRLEGEFPKAFHVSPFFGMQQTYRWWFAPPGESLTVAMRNVEGGDVVLDVGLQLSRRPITGTTLALVLLRFPLVTAKASMLIYWQAFRLWSKRTPFFVHPRKAHE